MNNSQAPNRQTNEQKLSFYIQDDENTMMYKPIDMMGNKFFGTMNKALNMKNLLNTEIQSTYLVQYQAYYKGRVELGSQPICFDRCINDVMEGSGLSAAEKNCMRECYMKRLGSRDDLVMYASQKMARQNVREQRDLSV